MTRLQMELSGQLGEFWVKDANKRIAKVKAEFEEGKITVDENGVARNCIGRPLMSDMVELLELAVGKEVFNKENTKADRAEYARETIAAYIAKDHEPSEEEVFEMRATFGRGQVVENLLTGRKYML